MRIQSHQLDLTARREAVSWDRHSLSARAWVGPRPSEELDDATRPRLLPDEAGTDARQMLSDLLEAARSLNVSPGGLAPLSTPGALAAEAPGELAPEGLPTLEELDLELLARMLEKLTGKKIRVMRPGCEPAGSSAPCDPPAEAPSTQEPAEPNWGIEIREVREHYEAEHVQVRAEGTVRTADGRQIDLNLHLEMDREHYSRMVTEIRAGNAVKDPLVLSLDGKPVQLENRTFAFDIDADGETDEIASLTGGAGYLAQDRNGDGRVNDGSELFGPETGNGFAELGRLDEDGNGWIDEADEAFGTLRIWSGRAGGSERLMTLREAGVGAISLQRVESPFALKDAANNTLGQVRSSGLFLFEETGLAGAVQQIDLRC
jgi:hypothetical protein